MTDLEALKYAIEALRNDAECTFCMCPGYLEKPSDMATCGRCQSLWELNRHMRERCSRKKHGAFRKLGKRAHKRTQVDHEGHA